MRNAAAVVLVFLGGFIIMVLEIIGARFLAKDFGSSFHVWVSQIGVVLIALALGYYLGGALADRWQRLSFLVALFVPAGLFLFFIPNCAGWLIEAIISRHPADQPISLFSQKVDPVLDSINQFFDLLRVRWYDMRGEYRDVPMKAPVTAIPAMQDHSFAATEPAAK